MSFNIFCYWPADLLVLKYLETFISDLKDFFTNRDHYNFYFLNMNFFIVNMKNLVFEALHRKKSLDSENILHIMDHISKETSDLRKVGIDMFQPAVSLYIFSLFFILIPVF